MRFPRPSSALIAAVIFGIRGAIVFAAERESSPGVFGVDSFETSLDGWKSTAGGKVSVSPERWKDGKSSLRWDFEKGARLLRTRDAAIDQDLKQPDGGVCMWLYCEKPMKGGLQFQVGPWTFPVKLGFTGWRAVSVEFKEDAKKIAPIEGAMVVPTPGLSGTVFLDDVQFGKASWRRGPDAQAPHVNASRNAGRYWWTLHDFSAIPVPPATDACTKEDSEAFKIIQDRYEQWMFGRPGDFDRPPTERHKSVQEFSGIL